MIAALFVHTGGPYYGLDGIDPWDIIRDARNYRGPHPVIAHPPCERWSKLAASVEARYPQYPVGVDGGCFASALQSLLRWGGVLEHPAETKAWRTYGLQVPVFGAWSSMGDNVWVTEIWQVDYGHRARKRTWLAYAGLREPHALRWDRLEHTHVVGFSSNRCRRPNSERLGTTEASRTPVAFRDELIKLVEGCMA